MYLNRQLIKILEDLGVPYESFEALQKEAVEQLRITTLSPVNASTFLDRNHVSRAAHLPWLIRKLHYIDLDFSEDDFLRNTLELAVLAQLREIKYRSRILVKDGWTLYGKPQCRSLVSWFNCLQVSWMRQGTLRRMRSIASCK